MDKISLTGFVDFSSIEQSSSPIMKQSPIDSPEFPHNDDEVHLSHTSTISIKMDDQSADPFSYISSHSRKSSSSTITTSSSLFSLDQISKQSSHVMIVTPPEQSKSIFRQILFDECDDGCIDDDDDDDEFDNEDHHINSYSNNCWDEGISSTTSKFIPMMLSETDDDDDEIDEIFPDFSSKGSITQMTSSQESSSSSIGLGISIPEQHEIIEIDPPSLFVTLRLKSSFYETVAERRKRSYRRETKKIEVEVVDETLPIKKTSASRSLRLAKLKAMETIHDHLEKDLLSPPVVSIRGKPKKKFQPVSDNYCKYIYDDRFGYFKCLNCKTIFRRLEHLKRHSRSVHSNIRPYECCYCDKAFARSDNLALHVRVHEKMMLIEKARRKEKKFSKNKKR